MSVEAWLEQLRSHPKLAVADLLSGAVSISPYDRAPAHEFLLALLPRTCRRVSEKLLGEPKDAASHGLAGQSSNLRTQIDLGLRDWLLEHRERNLPRARRLSNYAAQVGEALQWPVYFDLPQSVAALKADRARWLTWLEKLVISAYRDPIYDYWHLLASTQKDEDDSLQFHWQMFVVEAFRTRSPRFLDLGLLALAKMPLIEDDSLRNLRLQVQALVNRYVRRQHLGVMALTELAEKLVSVKTRNQSLSAVNFHAFLEPLLHHLDDHKKASVFAQLGLGQRAAEANSRSAQSLYKLDPPGRAEATDQAVQGVRESKHLSGAWKAIRPLLTAHEAYLRKSGDPYFFVRNLDRCARSLCEKYEVREPEIRDRLFQWIHLSLQVDADDPRLWMLWELALRKAGHAQRAQWVLWEMTRRFPEQLACRVELARLLAQSLEPTNQAHSQRLLQEVLRIDPDHLHAYSTLAQLATKAGDYAEAISLTQKGLAIDSTNESCAVLHAQAYARRNAPGDLTLAIEALQRYVTANKGKVRAEGYLNDLLRRQNASSGVGWVDAREDDSSQRTDIEVGVPEADEPWLAFSRSVLEVQTGNANASEQAPVRNNADIPGFVLPLPQALKQALERDELDLGLLDEYDEKLIQEYPLEAYLWRHLAALHESFRSPTEVRERKHLLQESMRTQFQALSQNNDTWKAYFDTHWSELGTQSAENALNSGKEWLIALLDRQRPLPAPILA